MLDRLTYYDVEAGKLVGWIASEFEANEDQTEFTFTIRDGVTFSDGSKLDAEAVKLNLDALGKGIKSAQIAPNVDFAAYKSAEVVGGNKVKVTLKRPDANFLRSTSSVTAGYRRPRMTLRLGQCRRSLRSPRDSWFRPIRLRIWKSPMKPVSVFSSRGMTTHFRRQKLPANQARCLPDTPVIKYLPEVAIAVPPPRSGQVDLVRGLQPVDEQVLASSGGKVYAAEGVDLTTNHAAVRIGSGKLEDVKVRQALQVAIDRQAIKDTVLSDSYVISGSILNHKAPGFVDLSAEIGL